MKVYFVILSICFYCQTLDAAEIGKPFVQLGHVSSEIRSIAFSPDASYLLSGSGDGVVKLWDTSSGKEIRTFPDSGSSLNDIAWSTDNRYFLSASDNSMKLREVSSGRLIREFPGKSIKSVAFTPDGEYVISGSGGEDVTVSNWQLSTGKEMRKFTGHSKVVSLIAFSPDGQYVISVPDPNLTIFTSNGNVITSENLTMRLEDVATGRGVRTFTGHTDFIHAVAFSPDGKLLVSSGNDLSLRLWDVSSGKEIRKFHDGSNSGDVLAYQYDLLSAELDSKIDGRVELMEDERRFIRNKYAVYAVAFSPDGKYFISGSNNKMRLWDVSTGKKIREITGHSGRIRTVAFSPDGRFILSGGDDSKLKLWNVSNGREIREYSGSSKWLSSVSFSPDGRQLVSGSWDKSLGLWDVQNSMMTRRFTGHSAPVTSVHFSPDGSTILSGSRDKSMRLWGVADGELLRTFADDSGEIDSVAYSPDGRYVLSSGRSDNKIQMWDISTGKKSQEFSLQSDPMYSIPFIPSVYFITFGPDGDKLIMSCTDGSTRLLDLSTGKELQTFSGHPYSVYPSASSPGGRYLVKTGYTSGEMNGKTMLLLDLSTGEEIRQFSGHTMDVNAVAFSRNGDYLASASHDMTIRLWNVSTGEEVGRFPGQSSVANAVAFSLDGRFLVSAHRDGGLKLFDTRDYTELASYYGFSDGEWIVITPDGYFNASPHGAEHLNVLTAPMRVAGIDQYYETFYRPDIVNAAIQGTKIDTGLRLADVKPAPLIEIINTPDETSDPSVGVTLKLIDQGGGIGDIRLFLNGTAILAGSGRGLTAVDQGEAVYQTYSLKLLSGRNEIRAVAYNAENSMNSRASRHTIMAEILSVKPDLHALVIGIDVFKNPGLQLNFAASDARLFSETLDQYSSSLFGNIHVTLLTRYEQTDKQRIIEELRRAQRLNPGDLFVFFVASHGTLDAGNYYLITSNVGSLSTERLKQDAMSQEELKNLIANIPTQKKLIILDTCGSQALGDSLQVALLTRGLSEYTVMKVLSRAIGSTILSASTETQEALEGYRDHGLFTYVISEGLAGKADLNGDGFVKTTELADYVDDVVPEIAEKVFKRAQYPAVSPSGQAFPIAEVR